MTRLGWILLLCCLTVSSGAMEIQSYDVRVDTRDDGSAGATVRIELEKCEAGTFELPLGFAEPRNVRLTTGPAGATITTGPRNGQSVLFLTLPEGVAASVAIDLDLEATDTFVDITPAPGEKSKLPAGARVLRHRLLNTSPETIGTYRAAITFPGDMRAHSIRRELPDLAKGEAGPRALLEDVDGRRGVLLQVRGLTQGNTAAVEVELVPGRHTFGWLIAGLALSILYLVYFRDLVARRA